MDPGCLIPSVGDNLRQNQHNLLVAWQIFLWEKWPATEASLAGPQNNCYEVSFQSTGPLKARLPNIQLVVYGNE